jgi:hypothetical protein
MKHKKVIILIITLLLLFFVIKPTVSNHPVFGVCLFPGYVKTTGGIGGPAPSSEQHCFSKSQIKNMICSPAKPENCVL